jgi:hypothetical protein
LRARAHRPRVRDPRRHRARLDPAGPPIGWIPAGYWRPAVVALNQDSLPARVLADPLACALDALGAAAVAWVGGSGCTKRACGSGSRCCPRGRLLSLAPDC